MSRSRRHATALSERCCGQGLVEYALILVLVAIIVVVVLATMGQELKLVFSDVVNSLTGSSS